MDVVGAQADDDEQEFIKNICEKELLSADSLLGLFAPLLIDICSSPIKYPDSKVGNIDFICWYEDPPKFSVLFLSSLSFFILFCSYELLRHYPLQSLC